MNWSDIPWNPSRRTLRQFAGLWTVVFAALAVWHGVLGRVEISVACALLAVTIGPLGLLLPGLVRPVFVGWMVLVFPVGWLVSRLVLSGLFFGLFMPIGLFFRLVGRDPLCRRRPEANSYWRTKELPADPRRYLRQY